MSSPDGPGADEHSRARSRTRDRVHGLLVVAVAFGVSLLISLWAKRVSEPEQSTPPLPPSSSGVVGWPNSVDVTETLPAAAKLTRRVLLRGLVADGVKSDGTIDVASGQGSVRYAFQSPPGHGPQPPREPGVVPRRNLCGRQNVRLRAQGLHADPDQTDYPCSANASDGLPSPRCRLVDLWNHEAASAADRARLARIEYYRSAVGPAWRFELPGSSVSFSVYGDCKRVLTRQEAAGMSP